MNTGEDTITFTVEQAARVLGISRKLAFAAVKAGQIPHVRIARRILIPRDSLTEVLHSAALQSTSGGER